VVYVEEELKVLAKTAEELERLERMEEERRKIPL